MRISQWVTAIGIDIIYAAGRPDQSRWPDKSRVRRLIDVFTTQNGSWAASSNPASIEPWARASYLYPPEHKRYNAQGGADVNLFGLLLDETGEHLAGAGFWFWSDGLAVLERSDGELASKIVTRNAEASGWANIPMVGGGSIYDPAKTKGPWAWCPFGYSDVIIGGGLPGGWHVSWFGVWQIQPADTPPIDPPATGDLAQRITNLHADLKTLMRHLGI